MAKSEKEKMIAGELYFSRDPELVADRLAARQAVAQINQEHEPAVREQLVKKFLGQTGQQVYVEPTFIADYGYNVTVGENFYANFGNTFLDTCPITIGDHCMFGPNVQLYTATHPLEPVKRNSGLEFGKPIVIGNNVWLGGSVVLTPGVTLGDNVVVAAGAVVTKSFGSNVVLGGNPARVIKQIETQKSADALTAAREKIDQLDQELVALLEKRLEAVSEVADFKALNKTAVLDESREQAVLASVAQAVKDPAYEATILATFEAIMEQSRLFQKQRISEE